MDTDQIENKVVKPMMIPRRFFISETKYRMNIGIVVINGARSVMNISAATEIFASLYSVSPCSSSLMIVF